MNDVYGRVSPGRLVPRERDAVTGQLTARREDKRRDEEPDHRDGAQRTGTRGVLGRGARFWAVAGVAVVVLVATVAGAVGLARGDDPAPPGAGAGRSSPSATVSPSAPSPSVIAAAGISLQYSGGRRIRSTCTIGATGEACPEGAGDFLGSERLLVNCVPDGCTVFTYQGASAPLSDGVVLGGRIDMPSPCPGGTWSVRLTPVGEAVTDGIRHPARITGSATARIRPVGGTNSCDGVDYEYRYDAAP